mgnify:CR=1 FL=1
MENNEANREKLSTTIVDGWDLDDLVYYATKSLTEDMAEWTDTEFTAEWENVFDDYDPAPATTKE